MILQRRKIVPGLPSGTVTYLFTDIEGSVAHRCAAEIVLLLGTRLRLALWALALIALSALPITALGALPTMTTQANCVVEVTLTSEKTYVNPFIEAVVTAVVNTPDGRHLRVPAFWAGGNRWHFRYASGTLGTHSYRTECSDMANLRLQGVEGRIEVTRYQGDNRLFQHGSIRIAADRRHLCHEDGTPFFWLGDTWWKGLAKRLTWEGFQELTADRKAKGFSVVQIVCGPYPDEGMFEPRWENEGGMPYQARDFSKLNPAYFDYADRRLRHLVDAGIVPAIVGGWGRGGSLESVGIEGYKRHWRNLIAHYGAYPVVWIVGGEAGGKEWTEVARYVRETDPYHRPITMHPFESARSAVTDESVLDFDMLQTGHGDWEAAVKAAPKLVTAYARTPKMPVLVGEACYETHMQTAFEDVQRYVFWSCILSGELGHTYGAAGVWQASVEGDPGITPVYDLTTWKTGMNAPGSTQVGLGKRLLESYPWQRFEPHPEWVEAGSFAAGIPGEVRVIYQPRREVYNWSGIVVKHIERDVPYHAFYFNPVNARRHDLGTFICAGPPPNLFEGAVMPPLFTDRFTGLDSPAWKDYGTPTHRQDGRLIGGKGMVTVLEGRDETDLTASVEAHSDAEAGIVLRFHDPNNYLVALYSPLFKKIYLHDRHNGQWGALLGEMPVPEIGHEIRITAGVRGPYAVMTMTDGITTYVTPIVRVNNIASGPTGLWLFQIGDRQEFRNFQLFRSNFTLPKREHDSSSRTTIWSDEYRAPELPSPQDWVLVLERAHPEQ